MDRSKRFRNKRNHKAKKAPRVPIKTYHWEDIRRARRRGGYPWTHLYKPPYTGIVDPQDYTMDALRRSKSATTMDAKQGGVEISELSTTFPESGKTTPSFLQPNFVTEPSEDISAKSSRAGSLIIEEYVEDDDRKPEDEAQSKEMHLESAESSDNISQYLDKDERGPDNSKPQKHERNEDETERDEDAEPKKRKLSAESSRSKYSLSKLQVMKKLRDAKNKIKVPKITFPTKKTAKRDSPPKESKKTKKDTKHTEKTPKIDKPVYIHIPLKPPASETDEFSNLESETKEPVQGNGVDSEKTEEKEDTTPKKSSIVRRGPLKINPAFKQLLKDVRQLKDKEIAQESEKKNEESEDNKNELPELASENKMNQDSSVKLDDKESETPSSVPETNTIQESELKPEEKISDDKMDIDVEPEVVHKQDEEERMDFEEQQPSDTESIKDDAFDKLFESGQKTSILPEAGTSRESRSKSAEPQRKRRSSIESSYSRKSLSKLGILKKLKEASEKIKGAFSLSSLKRQDSKKEQKPPKPEVTKHKKPKSTAVVKLGQMDPPKIVEPTYIHIPLKPPPGQTDEFSYLEFEGAVPKVPEVKKEERTDSLDSTSPISQKNNDIQFIFLTPPSDDEILDDKGSDVPDTPSSEDISFFGSLKQLAEKVVDEISPETRRKRLETVSEENGTEKSSNSDIQSLDVKFSESPVPEDQELNDEGKNEDEPVTKPEETIHEDVEKMVIDEEDGLNEPSRTEELKSALKSDAPTLKKKVSFKRKPKTKDTSPDQKESGYEPIETPKEETEIAVSDDKKEVFGSDINQSMSVDEEKSYLDQKIVKDASLEEDYNKWSKSGDHEYELINPPEEVTVMSPDMTVIDTNHEPRVVISATEILNNPPVEEKKKSFFNFGRFQREKPHEEEADNQTDAVSASAEEERSPEGPSKFQTAIKQRTDQLKNKTNELCSKMRNIKKPHINMPKAPEFKKPQFKKPDFKKFKIEKPKLHLPKIPDTTTLHLPKFGLSGSKKTIEKQTIETRQFSTESNAGDLEPKKHSKFDFDFGSTFPRFKKKKKPQAEEVSFATVPRTKKQERVDETVRVPLHSEDSEDRWESDDENVPPRTGYEDRETSTDIERSSHGRFDKDIAVEDDYERENQEINRVEFLNRWKHGNFSNADEDDHEDRRIVEKLVEERFKRVGDSFGRHNENQPKYIDEEDGEEFEYNGRPNRDIITDLDNLDDDENGQKDGYSSEGSVGLYKKGRLGKLDINSDEFFVVHEIHEGFHTPSNALAQMNEYDPIGSNRSLPQPVLEKVEKVEKRTPIKKPKRKKTPHVSQERIAGDEESVEDVAVPPPSRPKRRSKKIRRRPDQDNVIIPYQETIPVELESERLKFPRESLGILGDDELDDREFDEYYDKSRDVETLRGIEDLVEEPMVPPRKHKSLKSLTASENESILTDSKDKPVNIEGYAVPAQAPPPRPSRRSRSHTSSLSRVSLPPSQRDSESILADESYLLENQQVPSYLLEKPYHSRTDSELFEEDKPLQPCVEEPCIQDLRDYMGYAIVDKNKPCREPPLPPPRTPPRRRKRQAEDKFATVPRNLAPTRPLRNYSTIGHAKTKPNKENLYENDGENKENEVNLTQYTEIDDDVNRALISGEVVQKMRQRPLPAPPRPPRKPRAIRKSLQDITSKENIASVQESPSEYKTSHLEEEEMSPVTESPPIEFVPDPIAPESVVKEPRLITPSVYSYEETVTHGSLIVEPLNGARLLPDSQLSSRERLVPVSKDYSDDEDLSEVPESFKALRNPDEPVKTEKLQVQDLDVDRLRVNELLANRIVVSDLDAASILTDDLQSKSGIPLRVSDIELTPRLLEEVVKKLEEREQKKTSPNKVPAALPAEMTPEPPQPPPRSFASEEVVEVPIRRPSVETEPSSEAPQVREESPLEMLEPEVDDVPPPRPPEPAEGLYIPSQPPASFYALRAKQYVDGLEGDNIPTAPRRKRHRRSRSRPISRSRSSSDDTDSVQVRMRSARHVSEPSIPELAGRLVQACGSRMNNAIKRLIYHLTENLLRNADGQQDLHVFMIILLVLIAGLILLGYGEDRTVVHLHHWEYFNPPKDI